MARRMYEDFSQHIVEKLGNRSEVTADKVDQWLNDALLWVGNYFEHKELQGVYEETLLAGQYSFIPIFTDLWWTVSFQNMLTGKFLEPDEFENIRRTLDGSPSDLGPARYSWWGDTVYVTPSPNVDMNIIIRYKKKPARWTEGLSPLQELYDLVLELRATAAGYEHFRLYDLRDALLNRIRDYTIEMRLPVVEEKKDDLNAGLRPKAATRLKWR